MRHSQVVKSAAIAVLLALGTSPAAAQDMSFDMEETEGAGAAAKPGKGAPAKVEKSAPKPPPEEGPPSAALASALQLYQDDRHQEASVQFQRVVEGETHDAPANEQKAQFFLGKSLYHLGYYQSALAIFDEISQQGTGHLFFDQTLQWLAQLASQLPEPAGIIEKIGRYDLSQIEQFNNGEATPIYAQLLYLLGRSKYAQGEFEQAIELFEKVALEFQVVRAGALLRGHQPRAHAPGSPRHSGVPRDRRSAREG